MSQSNTSNGPTYHADGHKLTLRIANGGFAVEVECPGEGKCQGLRDFSGEPTCIVQYNAREYGAYDFIECQETHRGGGGEYRDSDTPCEIEWRDWGTDGGYWGESEYEFWWRPA